MHAKRKKPEGKYWPSLQQLLQVVAEEHPVAVFMDRSDEAVVRARGVATPDFLRRLFSNLYEIRVMKGGPAHGTFIFACGLQADRRKSGHAGHRFPRSR
ncbi:hypothetical protein H5A34_08555 [Pectobacterium brasiliense]|nr:hypothetical protein [Pectobacterium brasiliense]MBN3246213.1 hypothetical protein [Pectobacterium brasiliense]